MRPVAPPFVGKASAATHYLSVHRTACLGNLGTNYEGKVAETHCEARTVANIHSSASGVAHG